MHNEVLATQRRDYSGLRFKNITPTDVDGFMEIQGRVFIFFELKHESMLPVDHSVFDGQRVAMERLVDTLPKPALFAYVGHNCRECDMIVADGCVVCEYRSNAHWYNGRGLTLRQLIEHFLCKHGLSHYLPK